MITSYSDTAQSRTTVPPATPLPQHRLADADPVQSRSVLADATRAGTPATLSTTRAKVPRPKTVRLVLDTSTRAKNKFGQDVMSQIFYLVMERFTTREIAHKVGCSEEVVTAAVSCWQGQIRALEGPEWKPVAHNPRRWGRRKPPLADKQRPE